MRSKLLLGILITAIGYWGFGKVSNVFAIPPGFASPIWPAAGWALLAMSFWGRSSAAGVFVASFLLNLGFAGASILQPSPAWIPGASIAAGSSVQVLAAFYLIQRFTRYPRLVSETKDAVLLGVLAGPVACVISATVGVSSLVWAGVIGPDLFLQNWVNWWVGDSIGVMFFAPILLLSNIRFYRGKNPKFIGFLLLYLVLTVIAIGVFLYAKDKEIKNRQVLHQERANGFIYAVKKELDSASDTAQTMASLMSTYPDTDYERFVQFSEKLYSNIEGTHAISWVPKVANTNRAEYEALMPSIGGLNDSFFGFTEPGVVGKIESKPELYPVFYIYPLEQNQSAIGFDLSSHPDRLEALVAAVSGNQPVMTKPIELVQEDGNQKAFLLMSAARANGEVIGVVSIVYRIKELMEAALGADVIEKYSTTVRIADTEIALTPEAKKPASSTYQNGYTVDFAGQQWQFSMTPTQQLMRQSQTKSVWFILIFAFLIVTLLGLLFLLVLTRTAAIEREVDAKTIALKEALDEAKRLNQVKSAFLASMSHELRTPLNAVIGFSRRLSKGLHGQVEQRYQQAIEIILINGLSLLDMINDILDLSKVEAGKMTIEKTAVKVQEVVQEVMDTLSPNAEAKNLSLMCEDFPAATINADEQRLRQIILNLVNNAIKFTESGYVKVIGEHVASKGVPGLKVSVKDTGKGIDEKDLPKLFSRYEQLGNTFEGGQMGTGLGLALVRELVELHGGEVGVESVLHEGSSFYFWLPQS